MLIIILYNMILIGINYSSINLVKNHSLCDSLFYLFTYF